MKTRQTWNGLYPVANDHTDGASIGISSIER
jgi:hypothetical protein